MTLEQTQQLSETADIAIENNDIDSLVNIYKIILQDQQSDSFSQTLGAEWFISKLTPEEWTEIQSRIK